MTILELLKGNSNARLALGRSWVVWDEEKKEFQIYHQEYGHRPRLYNVATTQGYAVQYLLASEDTNKESE